MNRKKGRITVTAIYVVLFTKAGSRPHRSNRKGLLCTVKGTCVAGGTNLEQLIDGRPSLGLLHKAVFEKFVKSTRPVKWQTH